MNALEARTPCRVDLAGGTLDLWPLGLLLDGAVTVNSAVSIFAGCRVEPASSSWSFRAHGRDGNAGDRHEELVLDRLPERPEREVGAAFALAAVVARHFELPPVEITTWSEAPRGSGLGGSSALVVALVGAAARLAGRSLDARDGVRLARDLEARVLDTPAGSQDHWAAWCGGLSALDLSPGGPRRLELPAAATVVADSLVVADTRVTHHSGQNNWTVYRAFFDGDAAVREALGDVARAASELAGALARGREEGALLEAACDAIEREWSARRRLSPAVTCPEVDRLVAAAREAGGAAKVCGAGGGGCVAALPRRAAGRDQLAAALRDAGGTLLAAPPCREGLELTDLGADP